MIFKITTTEADTCGNETEIDSTYLEATSLLHAWRKLNKPKVHTYWIGNKRIYFERTPKGMGYGIWENNPKFDFNKDKQNITAFAFCGDGFIYIYIYIYMLNPLQ